MHIQLLTGRLGKKTGALSLGALDFMTTSKVLSVDWKLNFGNLITLTCIFVSIVLAYSQLAHKQELIEKSISTLNECLITSNKRNDLLYDEIRIMNIRLAVLQTQFEDRRFPSTGNAGK